MKCSPKLCVCVCVTLQKPKISYSFFPPPNVIGVVLRVLGSLQRISKCLIVFKCFLIIGDVPVLTTEDSTISQPAKILNFLRKQVGGPF